MLKGDNPEQRVANLFVQIFGVRLKRASFPWMTHPWAEAMCSLQNACFRGSRICHSRSQVRQCLQGQTGNDFSKCQWLQLLSEEFRGWPQVLLLSQTRVRKRNMQQRRSLRTMAARAVLPAFLAASGLPGPLASPAHEASQSVPSCAVRSTLLWSTCRNHSQTT